MSTHYTVAIIGAGPGGLGAALNAAAQGVSHVLIEKAEVGNTIFDYQLRKHVMAEPSRLPLRSQLPFVPGTREEVLEAWNKAVADHTVNVEKAEVLEIKKQPDETFLIVSANKSWTADKVILGIGLQGSPRRLEAPGEEKPHVAYTLRDPDEFVDQDILVIGAGDAAIENAMALAEKNRVSILNRGAEFPRAKDANAAAIMRAVDTGVIRGFYNSELKQIDDNEVIITTENGDVVVPCTHIIARIGAIMPRRFLESCGIKFPNSDITACPVVNGSYESNIKGLFIIGALIGYPLIKQAINQGYEVIEHILGKEVEPADQVLVNETLTPLGGSPADHLAMIQERLPLFQQLSEPQFRELIIDSTIHTPAPGEVIFELNDYTDTFFSVVKGSVAIELPSGVEIPVPEGAFFGEMGLLSGRRRAATTRMKTEGILLETPRKQMLKLINSVETVKKIIDSQFSRNVLKRNLFTDVSDELLDQVIEKSTFRLFKKNEVLFSEGDTHSDVLYVIRKGSVKISRRNSDGDDVAQTYLPAGHYIGEMSLLSDEPIPRSATVTAAVPCETLMIGKAEFQAALSSAPEAARRVMQTAKERIIENATMQQDAEAGQMLDFVVREGVTDAENVLVIDSDLCIACDNCEKACAATHGGYSRLDRKGGKSFARIQVPISCRHCENPLCMTDCPPDALERLPHGEVIIKDSCIGCGNCVVNCPYGVIQMIYEKPSRGFSLFSLFSSSASKDKGQAKAGKCDMCRQLPGGPACVRSCPTGAAMRINPRKLLSIIQ